MAEVKQLDLSKEDLRRGKELADRGHTSWTEEPGRRIRGKINKAASQVGPFAKRGVAGVLVLFDGTQSLSYLDGRNVMNGMYGVDALELERSPASPLRQQSSRWKSGGKEKMTATANTSISAVAALRIDPDGAPYLVLYHNCYAAVPLHASCVARLTEYQFARQVRRPAGVDAWVHAISGEIPE